MFDDNFFDKHEKRAFKFFGAFALLIVLFYVLVIGALITIGVLVLKHYGIL